MVLHEVGEIPCRGSPPVLDNIAIDTDEDGMQGVIRHMVCLILQPFAEHVRQLQTQMLHLQQDMHLMDERTSQNRAHLEQHDRDFLAARACMGQMGARMDKIQLEQDKEHHDKVKLENELESTKAELANTNDRQQTIKLYADALQQRLEELSSGFDTLRGTVGKLDSSFRGHSKSFQHLKESHAELMGHHTEGQNVYAHYKEHFESLEREFQRFLKNQKKQSEEDTQILGSLNAHVTSLHAAVEDTRESLHKTTADLRSTNGEMQVVKTTLDHVTGQLKLVDDIQRTQQEMNHNLRKTMDQLSKTDGTLEKLGDAFVTERKNSSSAMQDLKAKADTHADSIGGLSKLQARQGDLLKDTVWRTDKLQRESKRLQEAEEHNEMEVQSLSSSLKSAHGKLEKHDQDHSKTQHDVQTLTKAVDDSLTQMRGDLGSTGNNLVKLNARFEASYSNLQGIGKGLQDVHRHIQSGENGMLAPKTPRSAALSMLPALSARGSLPPTRAGPPSTWAGDMLVVRPQSEAHGVRPSARAREDTL
uniref:Uncharacterized protein n=1 Tax=Alexandrium catenella TaxID=2925 RepID=A0A7S1WY63_ALECA